VGLEYTPAWHDSVMNNAKWEMTVRHLPLNLLWASDAVHRVLRTMLQNR